MKEKCRATLVISFDDFFEMLKLPEWVKATEHITVDNKHRDILVDIETEKNLVQAITRSTAKHNVLYCIYYERFKELAMGRV